MASRLESLVETLDGLVMYLVYGFIVVELSVLWFLKKWRSKRESWVSLACYQLGGVPYHLFFALLQYQIMVWMYDHARILTLGDEWYVWVLAFVCFDLGWWAVHFAAHRVRFLWCIHGAHHTATDMNSSVAIRGSFVDFVQYIHLMIWLPVLGFHPLSRHQLRQPVCALGSRSRDLPAGAERRGACLRGHRREREWREHPQQPARTVEELVRRHPLDAAMVRQAQVPRHATRLASCALRFLGDNLRGALGRP